MDEASALIRFTTAVSVFDTEHGAQPRCPCCGSIARLRPAPERHCSVPHRNGTGDMVVLSMEEYERRQALVDLYCKLAVAEQEIASGAEGEDLLTVARQMRERVHGKL